MKIRIANIAACVGTLALALAASTGAFAQGVHINNDGLGQADRGSQKTGPALPKTQKQKTDPVTAQPSIFDRWGNLRSKK
jgi:hypothetical protein